MYVPNPLQLPPTISFESEGPSDSMTAVQIFAGNPLDRGERERRDEDWIRRASLDCDSRFLLLWKFEAPLSSERDPRLIWTNRSTLDSLGLETEPVLLGLLDGVPHFAADISSLDDPTPAMPSNDAAFVDRRCAAVTLPASDAGILCQAAAQLSWHSSHRFCSACGRKSEIRRGGQMRQCVKCGALHFPRTDPVVITVVSSGDQCLLGQSRGRMTRLKTYSCLAGFMDQGESIEEAVAREIMEESGIRVKDIRYCFSQPWPFPHTLMIGCEATAATTEILRDEEEMEDVRWFHKDEVWLALEERNPRLMLPGPIAIAHHLIKRWATS